MPQNPLKPFVPSRERPWDESRAAHLARRAGFGATPDQLRELVELGAAGAVNHFVDFPDEDTEVARAIERAGSGIADPGGPGESTGADAVDAIRRRWLFRMVHGSSPLQEKLTLFWHDHFATQQSKVLRAPLIEGQLQLLRRHAGGSFRELIRGIARDPAMLVLLDNRLSEAKSPNENWARELLELYTLGVDQYVQRDVVELARVFTGWTTPQPHIPEFVFRPDLHDTAHKHLFGKELPGQEGPEEGNQALDLILAKPECAEFLAWKLCAWFVDHEVPRAAHCPPVRALADVLRSTDYNLRETMRVLLRSAWFHDPAHELALYKNPVELAVGTLRLLEVQNAHLAGLEQLTAGMGMRLFEPPSVAGWEHGQGWVDSGAVVQRFNFALTISELPHTARTVEGRPALNLDALAGPSGASAERHLDGLAWRLLQRPLRPEQRDAVLAYMVDAESREASDTSPAKRRRGQTRAAIHLLLTVPEYALA